MTSGPVSSCSLFVASCVTCSDTESGVCDACANGYTLTSGICAAPAAALTDATFSTAVASCLGENQAASPVMACAPRMVSPVDLERCLTGTLAR